MKRKLLLCGASAVALSWGWSATASGIYLYSKGFGEEFTAPWIQWWTALSFAIQDAGQHRMSLPVIKEWLNLAGAAALPSILAVAGIQAIWRARLSSPFGAGRKPLEIGETDNHGHASWMDMGQAKSLFPGPEGMVIGESYRPDVFKEGIFQPRDRSTWGEGGKHPLLVDLCQDGPTHGLEFSSPDGFKTSGAVTKILHWPGSAVILDVKSEFAPMLTRDCEERSRRVVTIGLQHGDEGLDALSWIDAAIPGASRRILSMTGSICGEEANRGENAIFDSAGRNIVAALLAAMIWDPDLAREDKNVITLAKMISTPQEDMRKLLDGIRRTSPSNLARHLAGTLMGLPEVTYGGAYFNATTMCSWLFDEDNARMLSGRVQATDLLAGDITVFVQTPIDSLIHTPGLARVVVDAFVSAAIQADGAYAQRMMFLIDEAVRLGPMKSIEVARDQGRSFGITLVLLYQSEGQLIKQWGKDAKSEWFEAVSWRSYSSIKDPDTAKAITLACGKIPVMATSEGQNTGKQRQPFKWLGSKSMGENTSRHEISRDLIQVAEVLQDLRRDEQIIFCQFGKPLRCGKAIWWRRPELLYRVDENRFTRVAAE